MNKVFKKYFYLDEKKPSEANLQAYLIPNYNLLLITSMVYFVIQLGFLIRGITNHREFNVYFSWNCSYHRQYINLYYFLY